MFSFWYRNIKVAENFRGNISFVKTQTRLKLLCLSWICWRCERQSWAESKLGSSCWFSADDLKLILIVSTWGAQNLQRKNLFQRRFVQRGSQNTNMSTKRNLACNHCVFLSLFFGFYLCPLQVVPSFGLPPQKSPQTRRCCWALSPILHGCWWSTDIFPR